MPSVLRQQACSNYGKRALQVPTTRPTRAFARLAVMRAHTSSRLRSNTVLAYGGPASKQIRRPVQSSSNTNFRRAKTDLVQAFVEQWAPVLQAEHGKMKRRADRLAAVQQILGPEPRLPALPYVLPALPDVLQPVPMAHQRVPQAQAGPGMKLTTANMCARWQHPSNSTSSSTDCMGSTDWLAANSTSGSSRSSNSWVLSWPEAGAGLTSPDMLQQGPAHSTISQAAESGGDELQLLLELRAALEAERESEELLGVCLEGVASLLGLSLAAQQATSSLSNIVPWAPAAAAAAAASTPSPPVSPAVLQKSTAAEVPAPLPQTAADSGSEHAAATADAGAAEKSVDPSQQEEQLVLVYLNNSSSSTAPAAEAAAGIQDEAPSVRYFRLPQEQQQYESAVQQGCRAVPLPWALQRGAGGAMSMEELAWMNQQQGCWGLDAAAQDMFVDAAPCAPAGDAVSGAQEVAEGSAAADVGAAGGGVVSGSEQQQPAVAAAVAAAAVDAGEVSGSRDDGSNGSGTVKVEVGVVLPTKPGQRVLLVGSHPTLGDWDLSRAWKLKWSDGHVWRGCLELPADIAGIEFKAVLKSAEKTIWERGSNKKVKVDGPGPVALQYAFQA